MLDKELIQKLNQVKNLKAAGQPERTWILLNKEILMSQVQPNQKIESLAEKNNSIISIHITAKHSVAHESALLAANLVMEANPEVVIEEELQTKI